MKTPLTAIILTKNEAQTIERCLKSLDFVAETIIIDDNSSDETTALAKKHGATVLSRNLNEDFAAQRNFGLEKASHDWVLFVDADEEVTSELKEAITIAVREGRQPRLTWSSLPDKIDRSFVNFSAYKIKRRDYFWRTELKYGETQKVHNHGLIRCMKKGSGHWKGKVHEQFITTQPVGTLSGFLNHYPHQTLKEFIREINTYSTLRAKELLHAHRKTNAFQVIVYPFSKFILTYFIYLGFLDGPAGFAYAFFMSFHSFLVRAKLYQYSAFGNDR